MTKLACLIAAALLASACSSAKPETGTHADASQASDAASASDIALESTSPDANATLPPGMSAPAQPDVACTGEADAAVECALPASTCALWPDACDAGNLACLKGSPWIVYYENPRCVAGHCLWDEAYFECSGSTACRAGACMTVLVTA